MKWIAWLYVLSCITLSVQAEQVRVAVSSNFLATAKAISSAFEAQYPAKVILSGGSTGKHFAQLSQGAPFDVFLAADNLRPKRLLEAGIGQQGSNYIYALGKLALYQSSADNNLSPKEQLSGQAFRFLSIANPRIAPYGAGAKQVLQKLNLWQQVQNQLVRGESVSQALQFVLSENAQLGFVALSQLKTLDVKPHRYWMVPEDYYQPIEQGAVLINDTPDAKRFLSFLRSAKIRALIRRHGYGLPDVR